MSVVSTYTVVALNQEIGWVTFFSIAKDYLKTFYAFTEVSIE